MNFKYLNIILWFVLYNLMISVSLNKIFISFLTQFKCSSMVYNLMSL